MGAEPRRKSEIEGGVKADDGKRWPRSMSVKIAAEYLSLSPRTIYNGLSKNAETPFPVTPKRYGKKILFDKKELDDWFDNLSR